MLQAIRDGSKGTVAKIIVGLIIMTFALFGIDSIVALGGGQDAPAEVNGEEISELKVSQMVQMQKRRLQSQFGDSFNMEDSRLRSIAVDGLINELVLKQAAKSAGVEFSDQEIDKIILQSPEFQVAGVFNANQFDLVLRSAGFTRTSYRELLRTNLLIQQAQNAFQASAFSTKLEQNQVASLDGQSRDFSKVTFSFEEIKKEVNVSAEDAKSYFDENSAKYMTEETVVVDFVELKRADLSLDSFVGDEQVEVRYEEMQAEAQSKKEYRAAHILLLEPSDESRAKLVDALNKIKSGSSFADIAKEISEDDSSKFSGGDLGFSTLEVFEAEFSDALSGLPVGGVSEVIETRDGLHLVKLLEERQPEVAPLSELKDSIQASLQEEASQAAYVDALETLKDEAFSSNTISEAAQSQGLTVQTSQAFSKFGGQGVAAYKDIVEASFSEVVLSEDSNSEVIEVADGHAIVVHLNKLNESKVKSFADVEADIIALLENRNARDLLKEKSEAALKLAREGGYGAKWESVKDKRRASEGVDSNVLKTVFALPESDVASYELVSLGNGDQVLVRLDSVLRPDAATSVADSDQKVSRSKAYNEYLAYQQLATEQASIERN